MGFLQSQPIAARREILFRLGTAAGGVLSGQTFSASELQIRKAGGSYANCDATQQTAVVELGTTGVYVYQATAAELNTVGALMFRANKAGALVFEKEDQVEPAVFGTAATGTLTTSSFTTSLTDANSVWKDALILFLTGSLAGQVKKIGSFLNTGGLITLATGLAFTAAPANGDVFQILNR